MNTLELLNREDHSIPIIPNPGRVLITGGDGSLGRAVTDLFDDVVVTDLDEMDVRDASRVLHVMEREKPAVVLHLAAHKHAPRSEEYPFETAVVNINGTQNIVEAAKLVDARVVLASTCKAVQAETCYGASKLVAERIVLNAGGVVARLYNVVESAGNVFALWDQQAEDDGEIRVVADCTRYFITIKEAAAFLAWACTATPGRYAPWTDHPVRMYLLGLRYAALASSSIGVRIIPPRRGDRLVEPLSGSHETEVRAFEGVVRVKSPHDADPVREMITAMGYDAT